MSRYQLCGHTIGSRIHQRIHKSAAAILYSYFSTIHPSDCCFTLRLTSLERGAVWSLGSSTLCTGPGPVMSGRVRPTVACNNVPNSCRGEPHAGSKGYFDFSLVSDVIPSTSRWSHLPKDVPWARTIISHYLLTMSPSAHFDEKNTFPFFRISRISKPWRLTVSPDSSASNGLR